MDRPPRGVVERVSVGIWICKRKNCAVLASGQTFFALKVYISVLCSLSADTGERQESGTRGVGTDGGLGQKFVFSRNDPGAPFGRRGGLKTVLAVLADGKGGAIKTDFPLLNARTNFKTETG